MKKVFIIIALFTTVIFMGCSVNSDTNDEFDADIQIDQDVYRAELTSINSNFRPVYEFEIVAPVSKSHRSNPLF